MSSTHAPAALTSPVIVTGAASGIGLACAELLAEAGRPVALWDLQVDKAIVEAVRISEATGVATTSLGVDVADLGQVNRAINQSAQRWAPLVAWCMLPAFPVPARWNS